MTDVTIAFSNSATPLAAVRKLDPESRIRISVDGFDVTLNTPILLRNGESITITATMSDAGKHLWSVDGSSARCTLCGLRSEVELRLPREGVRARYPKGHRVRVRVYNFRGAWVRKPPPCSGASAP